MGETQTGGWHATKVSTQICWISGMCLRPQTTETNSNLNPKNQVLNPKQLFEDMGNVKNVLSLRV